MSKSTVSGPMASLAGFQAPVVVTADLPAASADNAGLMVCISDNGIGDDEFAVVVSNGTAWTLTTGAALT